MIYKKKNKLKKKEVSEEYISALKQKRKVYLEKADEVKKLLEDIE